MRPKRGEAGTALLLCSVQVVLLGESNYNIDMTRRHAYLFGGSRDVDSTPLSIILSSIQLDGSLHYTTFTIVEKLKQYFENDLPHYLNYTFVIDNII